MSPLRGDLMPRVQPRYQDLPAHAKAKRDLESREEMIRQRERTQRRTDERVAREVAKDPDTCCIPGCREKPEDYWATLPKVHRESVTFCLPICSRHQVIIYQQALPCWSNPDVLAVREKQATRYVEVEDAEWARQADHEQNGGSTQGHIYFVRINGMVKVGWSGKLRSRLKQYGASAEVLCHYPASRADETLLHRQLRPYLARGREWYQDCPLIADTVAASIARHGKPSILPDWTEPKPDAIGKRRR